MTKEKLAEIKAREKAATEGPWCWTYSGSKDNGYIVGKAWQDGIACEGHVENDDDFEEPILIGEHEAATCNYGDPLQWTNDPNAALHFADIASCDQICAEMPDSWNVKITGHSWMGPPGEPGEE